MFDAFVKGFPHLSTTTEPYLKLTSSLVQRKFQNFTNEGLRRLPKRSRETILDCSTDTLSKASNDISMCLDSLLRGLKLVSIKESDFAVVRWPSKSLGQYEQDDIVALCIFRADYAHERSLVGIRVIFQDGIQPVRAVRIRYLAPSPGDIFYDAYSAGYDSQRGGVAFSSTTLLTSSSNTLLTIREISFLARRQTTISSIELLSYDFVCIDFLEILSGALFCEFVKSESTDISRYFTSSGVHLRTRIILFKFVRDREVFLFAYTNVSFEALFSRFDL